MKKIVEHDGSPQNFFPSFHSCDGTTSNMYILSILFILTFFLSILVIEGYTLSKSYTIQKVLKFRRNHKKSLFNINGQCRNQIRDLKSLRTLHYIKVKFE